MVDFGNVEEEYRKNKELKKDDVQLLKEWAEKQTHLPKITEFQLILFLHSCYYRIEPTKTCIDNFYTCRTHCPEFFKNRNPRLNPSEIFEPFLMVPLSRLTPEGYQIIFVKFTNADPNTFVVQNAFKSFDMTAMLSLHQGGTTTGHLIVADIKEMAFGHVTKFYPTCIAKFFFYLQEALPFRLKGLYYINIPPFMDRVMAIVKPFVKKELLNSLKLYTDKLDDLYKIVPQECFPSDYGGQTESVSELIEKRKHIFLAHENFFVEEEEKVSDESRRMGKNKNTGNIFGVEGTFKKLDID